MVAAHDLDLALSLVAFRGERRVGVVALGVRKPAGWIGGLGVVTDERRHGIGRALMEAVLDGGVAAGIGEVTLEVLEPNLGALALYEQLGFRRTRMLEVWTLDAEVGSSAAVDGAVERARAWLRSHRADPEPWQRADGSLPSDPEALSAALLGDDGAALFKVGSGTVDVLQLGARTPGAAVELLKAMRGRASRVRLVNVPEGDVASDAMRRLGGRLEVRQHELAWSPST
jgi:acetyltransferase (GNAT) family protein